MISRRGFLLGTSALMIAPPALPAAAGPMTATEVVTRQWKLEQSMDEIWAEMLKTEMDMMLYGNGAWRTTHNREQLTIGFAHVPFNEIPGVMPREVMSAQQVLEIFPDPASTKRNR